MTSIGLRVLQLGNFRLLAYHATCVVIFETL